MSTLQYEHSIDIHGQWRILHWATAGHLATESLTYPRRMVASAQHPPEEHHATRHRLRPPDIGCQGDHHFAPEGGCPRDLADRRFRLPDGRAAARRANARA